MIGTPITVTMIRIHVRMNVRMFMIGNHVIREIRNIQGITEIKMDVGRALAKNRFSILANLDIEVDIHGEDNRYWIPSSFTIHRRRI
jgi:hypothetical protein